MISPIGIHITIVNRLPRCAAAALVMSRRNIAVTAPDTTGRRIFLNGSNTIPILTYVKAHHMIILVTEYTSKEIIKAI